MRVNYQNSLQLAEFPATSTWLYLKWLMLSLEGPIGPRYWRITSQEKETAWTFKHCKLVWDKVESTEISHLPLDKPHCTSANWWSQCFQCPDFSPKTPLYSSNSGPTNYTYAHNPLLYSIFAPRNVLDLENIVFADEVVILSQKKYYVIPVFFCEELHTWFFPPINTSYFLVFSKVTGALVKQWTTMGDWIIDKGMNHVGVWQH